MRGVRRVAFTEKKGEQEAGGQAFWGLVEESGVYPRDEISDGGTIISCLKVFAGGTGDLLLGP